MDKMIEFLITAKKNTYAAKAAETPPSRMNSHDLRFEDDAYVYLDSFLGGERFAGEEAVWKRGNPVWAMNYAGRTLGNDFSGDFLKAALMRVPIEKPYRGPEKYSDGEYVYQCDVSGGFEWFHGYEAIYKNDAMVYECRFHGGTVK